MTTQYQVDRSRRVDADGEINSLFNIIKSQKIYPYIKEEKATIAGTVEPATHSLRVRVLIATAMALKLVDDTLTNEVASEAAGVEERSGFNAARTPRSWRSSLAVPRLSKKYRDEKIVVREW